MDKLSSDCWTHFQIINGYIAQLLLDRLSNQYWTQCPMIIWQIDQCVLNKFQINIGQNIGQLNLPWTIRPRYTRFDILSNDFLDTLSISNDYILYIISLETSMASSKVPIGWIILNCFMSILDVCVQLSKSIVNLQS